MMVRVATVADIPEMMRIRAAVRENRLVSLVIGADQYTQRLDGTSRGWVVDGDDGLAGFAYGDRANANVWALFVDPAHERRGVGRALHDAMVAWLHEAVPVIWLSTERGTRAEAFYRAAGWRETGDHHGEIRFELAR